MKIVVLVMIACILFALGSALVSLIRHRGTSEKTVKSLTIRVALSIALFVLLMFSFAMGWIKPHGIV